MRPDIVPGAGFPDYELPDRPGTHRALSELQGTIRWCWCSPAELLDIGSAEQRTAWERGEKAGFHPYGKTQAQVFAEQD
jgi:hypothetical protein